MNIEANESELQSRDHIVRCRLVRFLSRSERIDKSIRQINETENTSFNTTSNIKMSENIPESVPTSQDARSKRPLKRRALTPTSKQASEVDALFANPEQDISLPSNALLAKKNLLPAPPEIVANVQGSSAGAGSGEFHVYKASRRREYERLRMMEEESKEEKEEADFKKRNEENKKKDEERMEKNRKKREKQKARKGGKGKDKGEIMNGTSTKSVANRHGTHMGEAAKGGEQNGELDGTVAEVAESAGVTIHDDD